MQRKKGISLIVLVITIIVMIILAAAIILSLNNAGIIGNANKAVDETNIANIKAAADLEYAEYLIEKPTVTNLGDYITEKLVAKGMIEGKDKDYYIKVYNNQTYVIKEGSLVDKYYDLELNIGDYVAYDAGENSLEVLAYEGEYNTNNMESKNVTIKSTSSMTWRVLGVEGDKIKLISADIVNPEGESGFSLFGAYGYLKGEEILNNACSVFGKGEHAISARSIMENDVLEITKFDKYASKHTVCDMFYDGIVEVPYGIEMIYDGKTEFALRPEEMSSFILHELLHPEINAENYVEASPVTYKNTDYYYKASEEMNETATNANPEGYSKGYQVLFRNKDNTANLSYWVATQSVGGHQSQVNLGLQYIYKGEHSGNSLFVGGCFYTDREGAQEDAGTTKTYSLRPVVYIEGNVSTTYDSVLKSWKLK